MMWVVTVRKRGHLWGPSCGLFFFHLGGLIMRTPYRPVKPFAMIELQDSRWYNGHFHVCLKLSQWSLYEWRLCYSTSLKSLSFWRISYDQRHSCSETKYAQWSEQLRCAQLHMNACTRTRRPHTQTMPHLVSAESYDFWPCVAVPPQDPTSWQEVCPSFTLMHAHTNCMCDTKTGKEGNTLNHCRLLIWATGKWQR